ncbi:hypothetical protein [Plantactinospora sp. WMMB782]|uniref:hypothetical protein n=1 Tax=Plantactinospora sp. WMMB782 TaxID=3404121 RepID=UPI003B954618
MDGNELGRLPLFEAADRTSGCYVDPAGKVVYSPSPGGRGSSVVDPAECVPAEPWGR